MKKQKKLTLILIVGAIASLIFFRHNIFITENKKLLLIDMAGEPKYNYKTINTLLEETNYSIDFKNFYEISNVNPSEYSGVILLCSPAFVVLKDNFFVKNVIKNVAKFSQYKNKLIGIFLPEHIRYTKETYKIFEKLLFHVLNPAQKNLTSNLGPILNKLLQHESAINRNYDTTLAPQKNVFDQTTYNPLVIKNENQKNQIIAGTLPIFADFVPKEYHSDFPHGFFIYNK